MAEKRVVVQVLADTKPFLKSLSRLKKLAEGIDSAQIRRSNSVLKALAQNAKINKQIQKIKADTAAGEAKAQESAEEHQKRMISGAGKYAAIMIGVARSVMGGLKTGYQTGAGVVNAARVYGVNPEMASRARALYSAFGGTPEEGLGALQKFLQNRLEFMLYQQGPLKEGSARFGLDTRALMSGNLEDFVRDLRRIRQERNLPDTQVQGLLQAVGLGGDPALMRMVTGTQEDFEAGLKRMNEQIIQTNEQLKKNEELQKDVNTIQNNTKTFLADFAGNFQPITKWFSELPAGVQVAAEGLWEIGKLAVQLKALKWVIGSVGAAGGSALAAKAGLPFLGSAGLLAGAALGMPLVGEEFAKGLTQIKHYLTTGDDWDKSYEYAYERDKYYEKARQNNVNVTVNVQQPTGASSDATTWGERLADAMAWQNRVDFYTGGLR